MKLPGSLNDLVPALLPDVPIDPFSGQPLRYRPTGAQRSTVYSVGKDRKDDGGQVVAAPSSPGRAAAALDVGVTIGS